MIKIDLEQAMRVSLSASLSASICWLGRKIFSYHHSITHIKPQEAALFTLINLVIRIAALNMVSKFNPLKKEKMKKNNLMRYGALTLYLGVTLGIPLLCLSRIRSLNTAQSIFLVAVNIVSIGVIQRFFVRR